jgi:hypothetical protein
MLAPLTLILAVTCAAQAGEVVHPVAGDVAPLAHYRSDEPDPVVLVVPEALLQRVRTDPEAGVPELVLFLLDGADDPFLQVKVLHDWVATNIRYDLEGLLQQERAAVTDAAGALSTGTAVCSGFAGVQELLLEAAGFRAHTIVGYARGRGFSPLVDEPVLRSNHAWTAVEILGAWYLMDTTWDAGEENSGTWEHRYSTDDLFPDPAAFAATHLPLDPAWQLLESPLDARTFTDQPFTDGAFHRQGLAFVDPVTRTQAVGAEASVRLSVPAGLKLTSELENSSGLRLPGATLQHWDGDEVTVQARFPEPGSYRLLIFTAPTEQRTTWRVAALGFVAREGTERVFPSVYSDYECDRANLLTPWDLPDEARTVRVVVRVPGAYEVAVDTPDARWQRLQPRRGGLWVGRVYVDPSQPVVLGSKSSPQDRSWEHLLRWPVTLPTDEPW